MSISKLPGKLKTKVVVCPTCKGRGIYRYSSYEDTQDGVIPHVKGDSCASCAGAGRLQKTTHIEYEQLKK
jgi:DnaJ-class molecular chaperone